MAARVQDGAPDVELAAPDAAGGQAVEAVRDAPEEPETVVAVAEQDAAVGASVSVAVAAKPDAAVAA